MIEERLYIILTLKIFYPNASETKVYEPFLITPLLLSEEESVWSDEIDLDKMIFEFHNESLGFDKTYTVGLNRILKKILKEHDKRDLLYISSAGGGLFKIVFFKNGDNTNALHDETFLTQDNLIFRIQDQGESAPNNRWHFTLSDIKDLSQLNIKYINLLLKYYYYFYKLIKKYDETLLDPNSNVLSFIKKALLNCKNEVFKILNELLKCGFITAKDVQILENLSYIDFATYIFRTDDQTGEVNIWFRFINEILKRHMNKTLTCIDITSLIKKIKIDLTVLTKDEKINIAITLLDKLIKCLNSKTDMKITKETISTLIKDLKCTTVDEIVKLVKSISDLTDEEILSCITDILDTEDYIDIIDNYGIKPIDETSGDRGKYELSMLITDFAYKTRIERIFRYFE